MCFEISDESENNYLIIEMYTMHHYAYLSVLMKTAMFNER